MCKPLSVPCERYRESTGPCQLEAATMTHPLAPCTAPRAVMRLAPSMAAMVFRHGQLLASRRVMLQCMIEKASMDMWTVSMCAFVQPVTRKNVWSTLVTQSRFSVFCSTMNEHIGTCPCGLIVNPLHFVWPRLRHQCLCCVVGCKQSTLPHSAFFNNLWTRVHATSHLKEKEVWPQMTPSRVQPC